MSWTRFVVLILTVAFCFAVSSVPTPLYPLYIEAWQAPPSAVGDVFAVYMMAVLLTLLCLGRLTDTFGWQRVLLAALGCVLVGVALSAFSMNVPMLLVGRALTGLGNGLLTTTAAIALIDTHPRRDRRIASAAVASGITVGFGTGPLLGGLAAQLGFHPLILSYVPVFCVIAVCTLILWRQMDAVHSARGAGVRRPLSLRPELSMPAGANRRPFLIACFGSFATFATGCCYFSLLTPLMFEALPWRGPMVMGIAFLPMAFICLIIQLFQRDIEPFKGLVRGLLGLMAAVACMLVGMMPAGTTLAFFVGVGCLAVGQGYTFMCSATLANLAADPQRRASNMSTYFLSAYVGACAPPIVVGRVANQTGLVPALIGYGGLLVAGLLMLIMVARRFSRCPPATIGGQA